MTGELDPTLTPDQAGPLDDAHAPTSGATASDAPLAGSPSTVVGGYRLGPVLGRGGMGEVLLAEDLRFGRDVAVKRMRNAPTTDAITRFLREAKIQARLDHPAIVPVHDLGYDAEGRPFFTMKRLAGTTLQDVLAARSATVQKLLRAFVGVSFAIHFAHERGVIHRDLKPANIT
nr:serine/threonine protein kinase [Myxococcota bacterium]